MTRHSNRALLEVLSHSSGKRPAVPHELILKILEYSPCWVLLSRQTLRDPVVVTSRRGSSLVHTSPPFTARSLNLFRKAVFIFTSHDQGWSSSPDAGSWTWFDVAVKIKTPQEDATSPEVERRVLLQKNLQAESKPSSYIHSLDRSEAIFYDLRVDDEIQLLACARFEGWVNYVEEATMEIWGVDTLSDESV